MTPSALVPARNLGLAVCALLLVAPSALASDLRLDATNTLKLGWFADNGDATEDNDDYARILERLELRGSSGGVTASARLDGLALVDVGDEAARSNNAPSGTEDVRLERVLAQYRVDRWRFEAGDQHLQLGRGILLSLKPVEAAGVDVALRGGQVRHTGPVHNAALFAGRANPLNFDAVVHKFVEDTDDIIAGGQWGVRPEGLPEFGVMAAIVRPHREAGAGGQQLSNYSGGVYIDSPGLTEWVDLYLEADAQFVKRGPVDDQNFAAYLSADLTLGENLVLVEGLYMDRFSVNGSENSATQTPYLYNRPPTLERFDQEVFDYTHVQGGRVRVERPIGDPDTVVHTNVMYRRQAPGVAEVHQFHGYAGIEAQVPSRLAISGGYRLERNKDFDPFASIAHGEADYYLGISGPHQLHFTGEVQYRTQPDEAGDQKPHWRGTVLAGYEWGALFTLTADLGVDTQKKDDRNYFAAAVLTTRPADWFDARVVAGTQRGGIRCIGGICRDFPAFAGVRTELVGRF